MPNVTKHYGLVKPFESEFYDVGIFNGNADKIDKALADIQTNLISIARIDITIPADSWAADTVYPYHCDIANEQFTADIIPLLTILPESMPVAQDCAMASCAQTLDGILRVYAETIPTEAIQASLALLGVTPDINSDVTGGVYDITVATPEEAQEMMTEIFDGNLPAGDGIPIASEADVQEMMDEVLGG